MWQENSKQSPFFIVGCPRSGTTLLQVLLDSHPHITIPPESHIFVRFAESFKHYGDLAEQANMQRLVRDILSDVAIKEWNLGISASKFCEQVTNPSVRGVISLLFELYARKEGKIRWGDKTPQHTLFLKEIKGVFPESKFIHLIRDGRDVAVSMRGGRFIGPKSIYGIANRWRRYILEFEKFKKTLNEQDFIEVHYEDLVGDSQRVIQKLLVFIGEDAFFHCQQMPNSKTRDYYIKQAPVHNSLKGSISKNKVGIFKKRFSNREIEIFESIAGGALKLAGYQLLSSGEYRIKVYESIYFFIIDYCYRYFRKLFSLNGIRQSRIQVIYAFQFNLRKLKRSIKSSFSA